MKRYALNSAFDTARVDEGFYVDQLCVDFEKLRQRVLGEGVFKFARYDWALFDQIVANSILCSTRNSVSLLADCANTARFAGVRTVEQFVALNQLGQVF